MVLVKIASSCFPGTGERVRETAEREHCVYVGNVSNLADACVLALMSRPDIFLIDETLTFSESAILIQSVRSISGGKAPRFIYLPMYRKKAGKTAAEPAKMTESELVRESLLFYNYNERRGELPEDCRGNPVVRSFCSSLLRSLNPSADPESAEILVRRAQREYLEELLGVLGITYGSGGWNFLCDAVLRCAGQRELLCSINKILYSQIAEEYGTSRSAVEKGIRIAAGQACGTDRPENRRLFEEMTGRVMQGRLASRKLIILLTQCVADQF